VKRGRVSSPVKASRFALLKWHVTDKANQENRGDGTSNNAQRQILGERKAGEQHGRFDVKKTYSTWQYVPGEKRETREKKGKVRNVTEKIGPARKKRKKSGKETKKRGVSKTKEKVER